MFFCHDCGRRAQYAGEGYHCVFCNSGFVEHMDERNIDDMRGLGFPGMGMVFDPPMMGLRGHEGMGPQDILREHTRMHNQLIERVRAMVVPRRQPQPAQGEHQQQEHEQHRHRRHRLLDPRVIFQLLHGDGYHWIGPDGVGIDGDEEPGVRAMTSDEISKLPAVTIDQARIDAGGGDPPQCTVCLEEMKLGGSALELVCKHVFHRDCIEPWLLKQASCPLCRRDLVHPDENDGGGEEDDDYYGTDEEDFEGDDYDEDAYDEEDYDEDDYDGSDMDEHDGGDGQGNNGGGGGGGGTSGGNV